MMQTFLIMYAPMLIVALSVVVAFWAGLKDEQVND
ncbi:putative membrane protein [Geobacillus kaustophilus]|uniref:Putative membrane protein n=1 Tax=Geobacillus kaustophilus TaxID=1462 RepID=A0A0D8BR25_GEOKU|nr:putative membrane protein [Geobacillus kaustophilus]